MSTKGEPAPDISLLTIRRFGSCHYDPERAMIDLHYWPTPNGWKIFILLEDCGLPYRMLPMNIVAGDPLSGVPNTPR